jgi:ABC-2 type transport system permease protein
MSNKYVKICRYFKIYKECIKVSFNTASTYRVNFILSCFIMFISNILFPVVTILIYGSGAKFPHWSFCEVLLIQSIFTISTAVANILFNGILWGTMQHVVNGSLEIVLIKPVDSLFYLIASTFEIDSIGLLLGGVVMFGIAIYNSGTVVILRILQFILLFIVGLFVMLGMALIMAATSFKWVANSRIPEIFESIQNFGKYPQSIFPKTVTGFTSFILPVAMVGYFPAAALLGKANALMFIAIIPCILFSVVGILLYKHMIHLYEGVGG